MNIQKPLATSKLALTILLPCLWPLAAHAQAAPPAGEKQEAISIKYTLPREAKVSLNVYDASGQIVREMLHADARKAGKNSESWDGLDESGKPVAAGNYSWKILATQGLQAEYLLTLGTNANPRWASWPGNHNGVWAVAQSEDGLYVAGTGEGSPMVLKQTRGPKVTDEKRLWSIDHWLEAWQGGVDLAISGPNLLMLQGNGKMQILEAATGKHLGTWDFIWEEKDRAHTPNLGSSQILDTDARGEQIVASYANHDAIRWIDPKTGGKLDEAAVPEPLGVALAPDGRVLCISKNAIVSLTRENKTPKTIVTGLDSAWRLAVDQKNGDIFVAERGASNQVKKFSSAGKLLKTFGVKGGRPRNGLYQPLNFQSIANITGDDAGGFYVTEWEGPPRRTAHFDGAGKLVREWYGGQMYANFACADPADPSLVWIDSHWGSLIQAKVDYVAKTWSVRATYQYGGLADGLIGGPQHGGARWKVFHRGTETLLALESMPTVLRVDEKNRRLVPLTAGALNIRHYWSEQPAIVKELLGEGNGDKNSYLWTDKNGDGRPQKDEMAFSAWTIWGQGWNMDANLNYFYIADYYAAGRKVVKIPVTAWSKNGVPEYSGWDKPQVVGIVPSEFKAIGTALVAPTADGTLVGAFNTELGGLGGKSFGQGWWAARVGGNKVVRWDKDGKVLWSAGKHAAGWAPKEGEAGHFWRLLGTVNGCIAVSDVESGRVHVWDKDGLWVGRLLDNPDLNSAPIEAFPTAGENFGGSIFQNPKTGNVIFFGGVQNNNPVYRIKGWDDFERQSGVLPISAEQASKFKARAEFEATREDVVRITAGPAFALDGDLKEWQALKPVVIKDGDEVRAKVWTALAGGTLMAAWDVNTTTPWKNSATPQLAFQSGASVSISLGEWEPVPAKTARPGDMRLVVASVGGKDMTMLYLPLVAASAQHTRQGNGPIYETGNGKLQIERFEQGWPAAVKPKPDGSGYTVEMQVPVWQLSHAFFPGEKLRFDASVALSNPEGTKTIARFNWHSKDAFDMATDDVFTEATLRPQNWGEARVE